MKEETIQIDRERVRERINKFIQNDGEVNIYVEAPSKEIVGGWLKFNKWEPRGILDNVALAVGMTAAAPGIILAKNAVYNKSRMRAEIDRKYFRTECQLKRFKIEGELIRLMTDSWKVARHYEEYPEDNPRWLWRVFYPRLWFQSPQQWMDKEFEDALWRAHEWLQENRPLEQCDFKNQSAIFGFSLLNGYNNLPTTTRKAPLNEFVAEEIRRIPQEIIDKSYKNEWNFKWVNGDRIVNTSCTLGELYGPVEIVGDKKPVPRSSQVMSDNEHESTIAYRDYKML